MPTDFGPWAFFNYTSMPWTTLCELEELKPEQGKFVQAGGYQLAVFLHNGQIHVLDNRCPHAGASLAGGYIQNDCLVCPWHHWSFHLDTGQYCGSSRVKLAVYKTRLLPRDNQPTIVQADLPVLPSVTGISPK